MNFYYERLDVSYVNIEDGVYYDVFQFLYDNIPDTYSELTSWGRSGYVDNHLLGVL